MKRAMQIRSAPTTEIHLFPFRPSVIFREIQAILVCIEVPDRVIVVLPGKQTVPSYFRTVFFLIQPEEN